MSEKDIRLVARIVFGEARGEPEEGQLAVAYTVLNRVKHSGYPNTIHEVVYQRSGNGYQYETLGLTGHDEAWELAKNTDEFQSEYQSEYQSAIRAATDALLGRRPDPTGGATDYAATDPNPATSNNQYWEAYNKITIENHHFVCRRPISRNN